MVALDNIEIERQTLQGHLDLVKSSTERNRLGQFATNTSLATEIVECAISLLHSRAKIRFLDPAIGTGAFYSALLRNVPRSRIAGARGYEIDISYGAKAARLWGSTPLEFKISDFTRAVPPPEHNARPNLIICNPPYVRHHHIGVEEKLRLRHLAERATGMRLSGLAGLYCYFLCLSHSWLAEDGIGAWLIPSEWMDVNYGDKIKEYLLSQITLLRVHRFDPEEVQFADALVSSVVVLFKKALPLAGHTVEFTYGGSVAKPNISRHTPIELLQTSAKWTRFPLASVETCCSATGLRLTDLFKVQRGLATGANDFFIMTAEQAAEREIPRKFLSPILPGPRYLSVDEINADSHCRPLLDRKLFLLTCNLPEEEVKAFYPALWKYLRAGVKAGIAGRYLCHHRSPWYMQEERLPAPLLCTYMGRSDQGRRKPFRFILNHSKATAANVYLMLYPKPALERELRREPTLLRSLWRVLNGLPPEKLMGAGRVYGGGLYKLEPRELGNLSADELITLLPQMAADNGKKKLLPRE
jgi:adenine-specific DNA-methyltransferase